MTERERSQAQPLFRPTTVAAAALVVLVLAVFLPTLPYPFSLYDDDLQVTGNPFVRSLAPSAVAYIFSHFCITSYYPVRLLSLAIDYHFWGLDPTGYRLTNVLLHAANVLLVFWLMLRLCAARTGRADGQPPQEEHGPYGPRSALGDPPRSGIWQVIAAAVAAAIFAVHPVVVEPVVWIPGREELLMTLFALLCLHFHRSAHLATERGAPWHRIVLLHGLSATACAAAAMCNAVAACIPLIVLAYDLAIARPKRLRPIIATVAGALPLWAIAAGALVLKKIGDTQPTVTCATVDVEINLWQRAAIVFDNFRLNLETLIWPRGLALLYPREIPETFLSVGTVLGIVLGLAALAGLWFLWRRPVALFGALWFLAALGPSSQIVPHHIFRGDRFLYLPLAGLVLAAGSGLAWLVGKGKGPGPLKSLRVLGPFLFAGAIGLVAALGIATVRQTAVWQDNVGFFQYCVDLAPENAEAHNMLGKALSHRGRWSDAIAHYQKAVEIVPDYPQAHSNLGLALLRLDRYAEAERELRIVLSLTPRRSDAYDDLGLALQRQGKLAEARRCHEEALRLDDKNASAHFNLAWIMLAEGQVEEALRHLEDAIRLNPIHADAWLNRGVALMRLGRPAEAVQAILEAVRLNPASAQAYNNLAVARAAQGDYREAIAAYRQAIELAPAETRPLRNLAHILATCPDARYRDGAAAIQLAETACRLTSNRDTDALDVLAAAYAETGYFDQAVATAQRAAAIATDAGRADLAQKFLAHAALYQNRQPLREESREKKRVQDP
jgi:tetratricopeptide (TPR) repeat protein